MLILLVNKLNFLYQFGSVSIAIDCWSVQFIIMQTKTIFYWIAIFGLNQTNQWVLLAIFHNKNECSERERERLLVFEADVQALRVVKDTTILLARLPDSGGVHNWQQLLHIVYKNLVEQPLIFGLYHRVTSQIKHRRYKVKPVI